MNYKNIIKYYFKKKNYNYTEKEFNIIYRSYKKEAKDLLNIASPEKIKKAIDTIKNWAETRNLNWSLSTVLKKWGEIDQLKPKEEKKKPFFRGERMYKKSGKWFVIPDDGGEHLEFTGKEKDITWK